MAEQNDQGGSNARLFHLTDREQLPRWQREHRPPPSTWAEVGPEVRATAQMGWRAAVATDIWVRAHVHVAGMALARRVFAFHQRRLHRQQERVDDLSVRMIVDATDWRVEPDPPQERDEVDGERS